MDEFAQTRQPDDLFDDDYTPYTESAPELPVAPPAPVRQETRPVQSRHRSPPTEPMQDANSVPTEDTATSEAPSHPVTKSEIKPPLSVRGDRSATGGILKPKLTEEELSARLAAARLNNVKREEAHRLAEADEAEFQQREAQEIQKRRQEGIAKREMDREREKNRQRKLAVKSGREWDESKEEVEPPPRSGGYSRGASGGYRGTRGRGAHGDVIREDGRYEGRDSGSDIRGRGRGRGIKGEYRGDRGRGGHGNHKSAESRIPTAADFPELPKASAGAGSKKPEITSSDVDKLMKPLSEGQQSWADQVEASK